jgi:hypothetical protein
MDTEQIETVIRLSVPKCSRNKKFCGVFPIDYLFKIDLLKAKELRICILNTDSSYKPGRHWFLVGIDCRSSDKSQWHIFIFDSLSQQENYKTLQDFLKKQTKLTFVLYNNQLVQHQNVDSCALHVIYVATMLLTLEMSFCEVMQTFNVDNPLANDCNLLQNFNQFLTCLSEHKLFNEIMENLPTTESECKK